MNAKVLSFILIGAFCFTHGTKERVEDQGLAELSDQLWHEIQKRLDELEKAEEEQEKTDCSRATIGNTIIKTDESIKKGALFVKSPLVKSGEKCWESCCSLNECDTAVYKSKGRESACYLFQCGSPTKCEFTEHDGFMVMEKQFSKDHESALKDLVIPTTTEIPLESSTVKKTHFVALFGECSTDSDCRGPNTECTDGYCLCRTGHHQQKEVCRPDCKRLEFECANEDNPLAGPNCIAIYNKCNGLAQCADGSDEKDCEHKTLQKDQHKDTENKSKHPVSNDYSKESKHSGDSDEDYIQEKEPPSQPDQSEEVIQVKDKDEVDHHSDDVKDNRKDEEQKSNEKPAYQNKTVVSPGEAEAGKTASDLATTTIKVVASTDSKTIYHDPEASGGDEAGSEAVIGVKVRVITVRGYSRSAMAALILGLVVSAMLLLFICCRCRQMQRQYHKRRPHNHNDADYLINGMYL